MSHKHMKTLGECEKCEATVISRMDAKEHIIGEPVKGAALLGYRANDKLATA